MSLSIALAAITAVTVGLGAQESPTAAPAGIDPARLSQIRSTMKGFVEAGKLQGSVALVAKRGVVVLHEAFGQDGDKPMRMDHILQVRSMTKMLTAAAIVMLAEDGGLLLSDPVEKHLPEFRGQMMIGALQSGETLELRPPSRAVTIRDLLTHTSGMRPDGSTLTAPPEAHWEGGVRALQTLSAVVAYRAELPLEFEPGTRWAYSGVGFETLGRIIEVVSKQPYERFIDERIFKPLGMTDSFFFPPDEKRIRMGSMPLYPPGARFPGPGSGANSTARDVASFLQMMADGGTRGGRRLLSASSVREMTTIQTGTLETWRPGASWGLGVEVRPSSGMFGHGTWGGSYAWVDPSRQLVGVFLGVGGSAEVRDAFMAMVAAAVPNKR